ncbi:hypothetical protein HDU76_008841 [Blyttiomyces sp. JEL0837]|nr:hypothetical protein HDU76_008841 [Blyttiomyces sp. JEL0837]
MGTRSLWNITPREVQQQILAESDILTRYLNHLIPKDKVTASDSLARDIWNAAIKYNFSGDLSLLPTNGLPDIHTGLAHVTSISFYRKLCQLRPDLAGVTELKNHFDRITADTATTVPLPPSNIQGPHNVMYIETDLCGESFRSRWYGDSGGYVAHPMHPKNLFVQIAMRQFWLEELTELGVMDLDAVKLFVTAGCCGHVQLFRHLLDRLLDITKSPATNNDTISMDNIKQYCESIFPLAADLGHLEIVQIIIDNVKDVDASIQDNQAIQYASKKNQINVVKYLLTLPNVDPTSKSYETITNLALNGQFEYVTTTFLQSPSIDLVAVGKEIFKSATVYARHINVIQFLLNYPDSRIRECLRVDGNSYEHAFRYNNVDIVKLIFDDPGFQENISLLSNSLRFIILNDACKHGRVELVKMLLSGYNNFIINNWTQDEKTEAFIQACEGGHLDTVKFLLDVGGVDVTSEWNKPIRAACRNGHLDTVKLLVDLPGVDPLDFDEDCGDLVRAIGGGHLDVVNFVLERNLDRIDVVVVDRLISEFSYFYLHIHWDTIKPSRESVTKLFRMLLSFNGVKVKKVQEIFTFACSTGYVDYVKAFLDVEQFDPTFGKNKAIREACVNCKAEVVKVLLEVPKVDPSACDNAAIRTACERGDVEIVNLLLQSRKFNNTGVKQLLLGLEGVVMPQNVGRSTVYLGVKKDRKKRKK